MNLDVLLTALQVLVTVLMAGIGVEMANKPPATLSARNWYRALFVIFGAMLCSITIWQAERTTSAQAEALRASSETALKSERDLGYLKGQLAGLGNLLVSVVDKIGKTRGDKPLMASTPKVSTPLTVPVPPPPPPAPTAAMLAETLKSKLDKCDVNGDGRVDILDNQEVVNQVLGNIPRTPAGDINGDGVYNVLDVQAVVNASLGGGCPY